MNVILETDRLWLREMGQEDYPALCRMLQDKDVMAAYEHAFDDGEAQAWLARQKERYCAHGFGLWAVILKETQMMIGQCGLTWQDVNDTPVLEVGYLFEQAVWHKGYATEAAVACKHYAFEQLNAKEVFSIIRDSNTASQAVALRNGMVLRGTIIKHYYGMEMPHLVFSAVCPTDRV